MRNLQEANDTHSKSLWVTPLLTWACALQAGLTDDVPVSVLAGSIVPMGAVGSSSTAAALRAPLLLLVALPPASAAPAAAQRCLPACAAAQAVRA